jgi:hypothetical protein
MTRTFQAGTIAVSIPRRGSEYAVLLRRVRDAGLLDRRIGSYAWRLAVTVALLVRGWVAFVVVGDSWWQLAVAAFAAVTFTQIGFLAHDAGHKQIFTSRRANDLAGLLLSSLAVGLGYSWWLNNHNRHHAHPNTDVKDPDANCGALAFTTGQAGGCGRFARVVYRYQAYFFGPGVAHRSVSIRVPSMFIWLPALADATEDLRALGDLGYEGEADTITVAFKKPKDARLTLVQQQLNQAHNGVRAVGERGNALLKMTFKSLRNVSVNPWRIGAIVAAALVLLHFDHARTT